MQMMTIKELERRIGEIIPSAAFETDNEGQVLIYTGLIESEDGQLLPFDPASDLTD